MPVTVPTGVSPSFVAMDDEWNGMKQKLTTIINNHFPLLRCKTGAIDPALRNVLFN
jgi:hypothetical protein